jgi:hypothetical protein
MLVSKEQVETIVGLLVALVALLEKVISLVHMLTSA